MTGIRSAAIPSVPSDPMSSPRGTTRRHRAERWSAIPATTSAEQHGDLSPERRRKHVADVLHVPQLARVEGG